MGMRPHIHALPGDELHRPEMIEEDEGADHLPPAMWQGAAHREAAAQVAHARHDDEVESVAGFLVAQDGIACRKPAHVTLQPRTNAASRLQTKTVCACGKYRKSAARVA